MDVHKKLIQDWTNAGQAHVFRFWNELNEEQRAVLCKQAQVRGLKVQNEANKWQYLELSQPKFKFRFTDDKPDYWVPEY